MREAAEASWELSSLGDNWEMGKVWVEKCEIFYEQGRWVYSYSSQIILHNTYLKCQLDSSPSHARLLLQDQSLEI